MENNTDTSPDKNIPDEYLIHKEIKPGYKVPNSKKLVSILVIIAVIINILIFTTGGESVFPGNSKIIGLLFSSLIIAGIIFLGLWWKTTVPATPVVVVPNIAGSVGGSCTPVGSERIVREPGNPASTAWVVVRTYTQQSLAANAAKYVPSARYTSYGFAEMTRTLNYTGQKQKCTGAATGWVNVGGTFTDNVQENATIQVQGGPGMAPLQAWTDGSIRQSVASGYYTPSLP